MTALDSTVPDHESVMQKLKADLHLWASVWGREPSVALFARLILLEPGFQLSTLFRLRELVRPVPGIGVPLDRIMRVLGVVLYSADLTPQARIGAGVYFPHPIGVVIGAADIGRNVAILQGVTLGIAERQLIKRVLVGDGTWIYAGAKVLGAVEIGRNVKIGANAVVLKSVPDGHVAVGVPAQILPPSDARQNV